MSDRPKKRCSTSLITREMQIKTTVRYHLTRVRTAIIKKQNKKASVFEDVEKKGPLETVGGNVKQYNHYGNQHGRSSKN